MPDRSDADLTRMSSGTASREMSRSRIVEKMVRTYDRFILGHSGVAVIVMLCLFAFLIYQIRLFQLDASADTLVLEHDDDLRYFWIISERYGTDEFLFLTYTPSEELFSRPVLRTLANLRDELARVERVSSVVTLLDVPLFSNPPVPFSEIARNIKTLESPDVDLSLARKEIGESPIYRELLISPDLKSTALEINLCPNAILTDLVRRRECFRDRKNEGNMSLEEQKELDRLEESCRRERKLDGQRRHETILAIRKIALRYGNGATLHLGGLSMAADDMITFVKKDLKVFGVGMLCFLVAMLGLIFRRLRWVVLPMFCCVFSATTAMGLVGTFGWQVTVISSNFISLQLVLTMAITIHLIVRYGELQEELPGISHRERTLATIQSMTKPCLYTSLTTIAGFCSLLTCDILPVINFGWMMTVGLVVSMGMSFLFFPAALMVMGAPSGMPPRQFGRPITAFFARFTHHHPVFIYSTTGVLFVVTMFGIMHLEVENSFIDYFRKSTEIYRGMKFIDDNLGGTTPLDVILSFDASKEKQPPAPPKPDRDDDFAEFDAEFEQKMDSETYWFTPERIKTITEVHRALERMPETGKVLSIYTLIETAQGLKGGEDIDTFELALLIKALPERFKSVLLNPYVSFAENEARINLRIRDSLPNLRRNEFLKTIRENLQSGFGLPRERARLSGVMVLYNNMLQSLFRSQINTIGYTVLALMVMFLVLFRSFKISCIAILPNLLSCGVVLGVMGLLRIPLDMMTITIVAISVGIAVDNTIHYLHRFKREFSHDRDYLKTMYRCHGSIGNAMYYTSITIVVGFAILVFSNFIPSVLFGLLTGLAMIIALLAALALLPRLIILIKPFGPDEAAAAGSKSVGMEMP